MIDKIFISLYSHYFAYYAIFIPIFFMIGICLLVSATKTIKLSKKRIKTTSVIFIVISLILIQQIIPYIYQRKALTTKDTTKIAKCYEKAISASIFKAQKAMIRIDLGTHYYKTRDEHPLALKEFDEAYNYLKTYNIENFGLIIAKIHMLDHNYDEAIKVLTEMNELHLLSITYLLKEDFQNALDSINKAIESKGRAKDYITRSMIYLNINDPVRAKEDYIKALSLNENQRENYINMLKKYKTYYIEKYATPYNR